MFCFVIIPLFGCSQTLNMRTSELDGLEEECIKKLIVDEKIFNETLQLHDSGITGYQRVNWLGPCEDNPFHKQKFQSRYEV